MLDREAIMSNFCYGNYIMSNEDKRSAKKIAKTELEQIKSRLLEILELCKDKNIDITISCCPKNENDKLTLISNFEPSKTVKVDINL